MSSASLLWLFSFRCLLPAPLPPAFFCTCSLSLFRLPASFCDTVHFSCPLLLVYVFFFLFGYLLLSYHSLSFARFSAYFFTRGSLCLLICLSSAWGSLFLLPRFLIPLGSPSVSLSFAPPSFRLRFRVSSVTSPWVIFSLFWGLRSPGFIASVYMDCSLLLCCVGLVSSLFLSSLSHSVRGSPSSLCHYWSSHPLSSFALF